jgi:hypothetical protein
MPCTKIFNLLVGGDGTGHMEKIALDLAGDCRLSGLCRSSNIPKNTAFHKLHLLFSGEMVGDTSSIVSIRDYSSLIGPTV